MDTVGVAGMESPFTPVVRDGRLHGRGAGDMKGSLAAMMLVGAAAVREGFRGDVIVTAVADEEVGSVGTEALVRRTTADAAIVTEPTEEVVAVAHKGFVAFEVETEGYAAHGSRPDLGVDAIAAMGPVLSGIAALDAELRAGAGHPLLGTGSLHASVIEGGQEYSSYPAHCRLLGERRTIPGETIDDVRARARGPRRRDGRHACGCPSTAIPSRRPPDAAVVQALQRHLGRDDVGGVAFWADSALLAGSRDPDRRLRPRRRRHPRRRRVGRPRLARALPGRVPRRRPGAVRVRRLRVVHVGVGLWGRTWAELIVEAPGYELVGVADAAAPGRAWVEEELAVPAFRDLGRALAGHAARRRRARLAALDAPAARRARARRGLSRDRREAARADACGRGRRRGCGRQRRPLRDGRAELPLSAAAARAA